jgi:hypothetical protein
LRKENDSMRYVNHLHMWQKIGLFLASALAAGLSSGTIAQAAAPASTTTKTTVSVPANQETAVDTGLSVISGSKVTISTTGTATYGPEGQRNCSGVPITVPSGERSVNGLLCGYKIDPNSTLSSAPIGAALASIGTPGSTCSTGWFETGSHSSSTYASSGELYLLYNDSVGQYGNDTGSYTSTVTVTEPAHHSPTCNKIVDLQLHQTPQTPLYDLSLVVTLNTANIACPGTVKVSSAGISVAAAVCQNGTPQSKATLEFPVFKGSKQLAPHGSATFDVTVTDTKGKDHLPKSIDVPPRPVWVGIGDSYSSGHNQEYSEFCTVADAGNATGQCSLISNDSEFSWVTKATQQLNANLHVPPAWKMQTKLLAHSGQSTAAIASTQAPQMVDDLTQGQNSWNVVSVSGGANDINFGDTLEAYYKSSFFLTFGTPPWALLHGGPEVCPDTSALYKTAVDDSGTITGNLEYLLASARSADPNSRLVDLYYPYIVNSDNTCSANSTDGDGSTFYGAQADIDELDSTHVAADATQSDVQSIDLRQVFGNNPLGYIQQTYFYGYPHANASGQEVIGRIAAQDVENAP